MTTWRMVAAKELKEVEQLEEELSENEARVKVFNVLLDNIDLEIFNGKIQSAYPFIPGRYAVGKVMQTGNDSLSYLKGKRVFLSPIIPVEHFNGDSTPLQGLDKVSFAGQNSDGFACASVSLPVSVLYELPDNITTETATFTYLVALAVTAIDKLGDTRGKYIAVIGGNTLGIILCKLLTYYQAMPILVDSRTSRLEFAKKCGITYAFLNDDNLDSAINDITGAAFADGTIYLATGSSLVNTAAFRVTAPGKNVVFCGYAPTATQVNLELAIKKELRLLGASNASASITTALNLLATKAIDVSIFPRKNYSLDQIESIYADMNEKATKTEYLAYIDCFGKL